MESSEGKMNREIRENISRLSTDALCEMIHSGCGKYTGFAIEAAKEELATRRSGGITKDALTGSNIISSASHQPSIRQASGCYVEVWQSKNFLGIHALIEGPAEFQTLRFSSDNWEERISSLRVGPRAFVIAYRECNFSGQMVTFGPNQEVPDLSEYRFDNEIDSVRLIDSMKVFDHQGFETGPAIIHPSLVAGGPEDPGESAPVRDSRRRTKKARRHR